MHDIAAVIVIALFCYQLVSLIALIYFQIEQRDPIRGEWIWLGGIIPLALVAAPIEWLLSVLNRALRGEG